MVKEDLVKALMTNGFMTYREARKFLNSLLFALTSELKKTRILDLPIGTLTISETRPGRAYRLGMIVRTNTKPRIHFKKKKD